MEASAGLEQAYHDIARRAKVFHVPPTTYDSLHAAKTLVEQADAIDLMPPYPAFVLHVDEHATDSGWRPAWLTNSQGYAVEARSTDIAIYGGLVHFAGANLEDGIRLAPEGDGTMPSAEVLREIRKMTPDIDVLAEAGFFIVVERAVIRWPEATVQGRCLPPSTQTIYSGGLFDIEKRRAYRLGPSANLLASAPRGARLMDISGKEFTQDDADEMFGRLSIGAAKRAAAFCLLLNSRSVKTGEPVPESRAVRRQFEREHGYNPSGGRYFIHIARGRSAQRVLDNPDERIDRAPVPQYDVMGHKRTYKSGKVVYIQPMTRCRDRPRKGTAEYDAWRLDAAGLIGAQKSSD